MGSAQTLSEADRRVLAVWAADCAERVLPLFEAVVPTDARPADAIARARAFGLGRLDAASQIRMRFVAGRAATGATSPAAVAAARSAAHASGVAHMGAHALGAAGYAAKAAGLAPSDRAGAVEAELRWQLEHSSAPVRDALRRLPAVGEDPTGPLGPGLLARGDHGALIRRLQDPLAALG